MVVGDGDRRYERALASVRDLVDFWIVCDTGTTARAAGSIPDLLAGIPGELHRRHWVDAGYNHSELMDLARDKADYLLLLDPDMVVRSFGPRPKLVEDAYVLRDLANPGVGHRLIVRGSRQWWFAGSLQTNGLFTEANLEELAIVWEADRDTHRLRLLRDLGALKREVATGHASAATAFYLAETLRDLGRTSSAIEWYRRRVDLGGSDQEVFYANLQEGILRASINFASAVPVLLEAWERRPSRAEPLFELARGYRAQEDPTLCYLFADRGLNVPYPADTLFVHPWIYSWGLRLERAWAAGKLGRRAQALDDLRTVLATEGVPVHAIQAARDWLLALSALDPVEPRDATPTQPLAALVPELKIGQLRLHVRPAWPLFNPSITGDGTGFKMLVRSANYLLGAHTPIEGGVLRNINYLVELDADLGVQSVSAIDDGPADLRRYPSAIIGFEDCRLIKVEGRWFASATVSELNPIQRQEIALIELDGTTVRSVRPLAGPDPGRPEKNWMPFVHDGELHFVYLCGPMIVLRCAHRTGELTLAKQSPSPPLAAALRGGSQGIALEDGGYLFVVHEMEQSTGAAVYSHRFIRVSADLELESASRPFTFTGERVEFCGGAAICGTSLVLSFAVSDATCYLATLPLADALGLLEPAVDVLMHGSVH
jgi:tetratricopeptide (TPR) repeat protein